jgi:hypothetical protein
MKRSTLFRVQGTGFKTQGTGQRAQSTGINKSLRRDTGVVVFKMKDRRSCIKDRTSTICFLPRRPKVTMVHEADENSTFILREFFVFSCLCGLVERMFVKLIVLFYRSLFEVWEEGLMVF